MGLAQGLTSKVDGILRAFAPLSSWSVYKRIVTRTGGNDLVGRAATTTNVDTLFAPQPSMSRLFSSTDLSDPKHTMTNAASMLQVGDYQFIVSSSAITRSSLESKDCLFVLKDSANKEEVLRIIDYETMGVQGTDVAFKVFCRSTKYP